MTLLIVLALNIALLMVIFLAANSRSKNLEAQLENTRLSQRTGDEKQIAIRQELSSLKEEITRKNKQLEELRELSRRKLRKEAQKGEAMTDHPENNSHLDNTKPSFDLALKTVQEQALQQHQEELEKLKAQYQERVSKLEAQLSQRKQNVEKSKQTLATTLLGQVESFPEEVVLEVGRLIRRSEHAEKLLAATRGKLQMSQERFAEMQKRYFGVCRELALASGQSLMASDEQVRDQAEDLLNTSEQGAQA